MAAVLSGTGAVLGAIIGGATEVSKRMGTVAIGAILGGVSGFMMGAPVCDALIVGEEISGASVLAAGMCSCIPIAVGIVAGATITKITGVALQAIRDRC
jgi:hypothetical protein